MRPPNTLDELTDRQRVFVTKYLSGMSQKDAALAAGYSAKSIDSQASQVMSNKKVKAYIEAHRASISKRTETIQQRLLDELEDMALFNAQDITTVDADGQVNIDFSKAERRHYKVLTKVKSKRRILRNKDGEVIGEEAQHELGFADKYRGIEMLGRHLGMFKTEEQRVVIDVADRLLAARARIQRGPLVEHEDDEA